MTLQKDMKFLELGMGLFWTDCYLWKAATLSREHVPVMIHVNELTQPQGHSTSGSHERYKDADRLAWEREFDCIRQMKLWMIAINIASSEELDDRCQC
jgi:TPP-dependent pyruvate/acetoin dehydrogenase alpha subunit